MLLHRRCRVTLHPLLDQVLKHLWRIRQAPVFTKKMLRQAHTIWQGPSPVPRYRPWRRRMPMVLLNTLCMGPLIRAMRTRLIPATLVICPTMDTHRTILVRLPAQHTMRR